MYETPKAVSLHMRLYVLLEFKIPISNLFSLFNCIILSISSIEKGNQNHLNEFYSKITSISMQAKPVFSMIIVYSNLPYIY